MAVVLDNVGLRLTVSFKSLDVPAQSIYQKVVPVFRGPAGAP
jgi:hypothetical protein